MCCHSAATFQEAIRLRCIWRIERQDMVFVKTNWHVEMINRYCYLKNLLSRLNISVRHLHSFKICKCIAKSSYHWCWLINLIVQCCGVFTLMFLNWYMYIVQWWYISYHICDIPQRFLWPILLYDKSIYPPCLQMRSTASKWFSPN